MHRLESTACKESQKALDKVGLHGAGLSSSVRMAPSASSNWPTTGTGPMTAPSTVRGASTSSASQPSTSWSSAGHAWSNPATPATASATNAEPSRKPRVFNIHQRLRELYIEECRNGKLNESLPAPLRNLKRGSRLLEKLVEKENLNTIIVNLYPGNKGYSLSLRLQGKVPAALGSQAGRSQGSEPVVETMIWPYSDEELLRCIDREELPTTLVDLLETDHSKLFYQGCIIAEIRDYRLTHPLSHFETHHVLLKPTTQSVINDVNLLSAAHDLSAEERLSLESQLVQVTAPPLCLDPNPTVGMLLHNLQAKKHRFSTTPFRRTARKFSQVTVNRKRKLDQCTAKTSLHLYDFIKKKRAEASQGKPIKKVVDGQLPPPPPVPRDEPLHLAPPSKDPEVFRFAKLFDKPKKTKDCSATLAEEYILETERTQGTIYHIKLSIFLRASNSEYLGELYVDKDYKEGERNGSSCRFVLGTRAHANRYIQQFTEIFTEEGRKSVRITHNIPGHAGRVTYTPALRERERTGQLQAIQTVQASAINQQVGSVASSSGNNSNLVKSPALNLQPGNLAKYLKPTTVAPNVNVHQIQHQQTSPAISGLNNSAIQSILSGVISEAALSNGPTATPPVQTPVLASQATNATVHYQPVPVQNIASNSMSNRPVLSSNPRVNALATSLRNSVEQFEMQVANQAQVAAAAAAAPPPATAQNPTILSLLNASNPLNNITNPKVVARKANINLQNTRIINQNLNAAISNNVNNSALLVNNNQIRVTLSSFPNQLVGQTGQTGQAGAAQPGSFTIVTTQANLALANQANQSQTYSLSSLTQPQGQTYTLTPNTGATQGFTLSPAQNTPTFTVLQQNPNFQLPPVQGQTFQISSSGTTGQAFTITTTVVTMASQFASQPQTTFTVNPPNQVFTVNLPQASQIASKSGATTTKSFTIQANNQTFAKVAPARTSNQRRPSNAFQQTDLSKIASDRSDARILTERHLADKSDSARLIQLTGDVKTLVGDNKLSQTLTNDSVANFVHTIPGLCTLTTDAGATSLGHSMTGLRTLLAGTPSADNPIPGATSSSSSLLERLNAPPAATFTSPPPAPSPSQNITFQNSSSFVTSPSHAFNSVNSSSPLPSLTSPGLPVFTSSSPQMQFQGASPTTSPLSSPPSAASSTSVNLQALSLQSLASLSSGLQVSIPIPISLNVSGQAGSTQGVLMTSMPVAATTNTTTTTSAATMVLSNSSTGGGSLLSLPVAQGGNARSAGTTSISIPQGAAQSIQLVSLQRPASRSNANQGQGAKNVQPIAVRSLVTEQRPSVKIAANNTTGAQIISNSSGSQMVALSSQQFQLLQKRSFPGLNIGGNCLTPPKNAIAAAALANKHGRRSSAADPNK